MGTLFFRDGKWKFERIGQRDTIVRGILIYTFAEQEDVLLITQGENHALYY